jgi:hypothetical protein
LLILLQGRVINLITLYIALKGLKKIILLPKKYFYFIHATLYKNIMVSTLNIED